jgi:mannose-6-phosphate isomerase-like protein (cupin superfamily)
LNVSLNPLKPIIEPSNQEERPWGCFTVMQDNTRYKLKLIQIKPGHRLSLQVHQYRKEHWIITQGTAEVTVNDKTWQAQLGDHIHIPIAAKHRIANVGSDWLEIIEVQQGSSFSEEDIVRFEDDYNRV